MRFPLPEGIFPNGGAIPRRVEGTPDRGSEILGTSENGASHYRSGTATDFNTEAAAAYSAETHRLALDKANVYLTRVKNLRRKMITMVNTVKTILDQTSNEEHSCPITIDALSGYSALRQDYIT